MFLSADRIRSERACGRLTIEPFHEARLKPASYVLSLGARFRRWRRSGEPVRLWSPDAGAAHLEDPIDAERVVLQPGEFILAGTVEAVGLPPDLYGSIAPLSHVARFGLAAHCGADFVNPGFGERVPTALALELVNHSPSPIELSAGMPIAHLRVGRVEGATAAPPRERSVYEGADPLVQPQLYEEWSGRTEDLRGAAEEA